MPVVRSLNVKTCCFIKKSFVELAVNGIDGEVVW